MIWKEISEIDRNKDFGGIILYLYDTNSLIECSYDGVVFTYHGMIIKPRSYDLFVSRWDFFHQSGLYDKLGEYEKGE